jgi:phage terminase Nu1 subunit (DNA packaging protein)
MTQINEDPNLRFKFSKSDCSSIVGISIQAISKWGLPEERVGKKILLDIREVVRHKIEILQKDDDAESLTRERTRLARAQADKVELENQIKRGDSVPSSVILTVWIQLIANFKSKLISLPDKLAVILADRSAPEIKTDLKKEINEVLEELRDLTIDDYITVQQESDEESEIEQ